MASNGLHAINIYGLKWARVVYREMEIPTELEYTLESVQKGPFYPESSSLSKCNDSNIGYINVSVCIVFFAHRIQYLIPGQARVATLSA